MKVLSFIITSFLFDILLEVRLSVSDDLLGFRQFVVDDVERRVSHQVPSG